jgi:hypothetical protein
MISSCATPARPYAEAFDAAVSFDAFLEAVAAHRDLWIGIAERIPDLSEGGRTIRAHWEGAGRPSLRLLVLADDWCGDAIHTVPLMARLMEASGCVDIRVVSRDAFPAVMDRHLTHGGRSIPMAILLDSDATPLGQWGPRPSELQRQVRAEWLSLDPAERYLRIRRWYARDRGRSTLAELTALVLSALEARASGRGPGAVSTGWTGA